MSDITIPAAVLEAVAVAEWDAERARIGECTLPLFEELHPEVRNLKLENAHSACRAMLENWPGMVPEYCIPKANGWMPSIILPLPPQENPNG